MTSALLFPHLLRRYLLPGGAAAALLQLCVGFAGAQVDAPGTVPIASPYLLPVGSAVPDSREDSEIAQNKVAEASDAARAQDRQDLELNGPNLATENQNALSVETESRQGRITSSALEVSGGYTNNLYNTSNPTLPSFFGRYSLPVTVDRATERGRLHVSYLPQFTVYSQAVQHYFSQTYSHRLLYDLSERNTLSWQLAGARYRDLGQFTPGVLPIGGSGVAQPLPSQGGSYGSSWVTNGASAFAFLHRINEHDRVTLTTTGAWNELAQSTADPKHLDVLRNATFAETVSYEHAVGLWTSFGFDASAAHVLGLSRASNLTYGTALATVRFLPSPRDRITFGAGPLLLHPTGAAAVDPRDATTYSLEANYLHQSRLASFAGGYARIVQLNLDNSATPGHQLYGSFARPVTRALTVTAAARYLRGIVSASSPSQSNVGASLRLDLHTISRLTWFASASELHSWQPPLLTLQPSASTQAGSFNRSELSGGLRVSLSRYLAP